MRIKDQADVTADELVAEAAEGRIRTDSCQVDDAAFETGADAVIGEGVARHVDVTVVRTLYVQTDVIAGHRLFVTKITADGSMKIPASFASATSFSSIRMKALSFTSIPLWLAKRILLSVIALKKLSSKSMPSSPQSG
jgi:hypothetical protein